MFLDLDSEDGIINKYTGDSFPSSYSSTDMETDQTPEEGRN